MSKWQQLTNILPLEVREQMADVLLERLGYGWGEVVLFVKDHYIAGYLDGREIRGVRPAPPTKQPTISAPPPPPGKV
jgi:hypothetical protein